MKHYKLNGEIYNSLFSLKRALKNVSFPQNITDEMLIDLGVEIMLEEEEPVYTPTQEEIITGYTDMVQAYLDSTAQTRNYDNILSLCTYATSTVEKFRREGQAGVEWRDAVWSKCYEILEEVQAGTRTEIPTAESLISELPVFTWGE